jgi:hypothetical protein
MDLQRIFGIFTFLAHFDPEFKGVIENLEAGIGVGCFKDIKMRLGPRCLALLEIISGVPAERVQNQKITANLDIWPEIFLVVFFLFKGCPPGVPF